jgi:hypothetical protein
MKDIASYKPRYPNISAVRKHIIEQFDLFDKDKRHKFKWLRMKAHGLGDIKKRLAFDLACEADDEEKFELETPRKAKQAKRSLNTDADTEGPSAKKSKPTDNGSINEPTEELTNNTVMDRFLEDDSIIPEKRADGVDATNSVYSNSNSNPGNSMLRQGFNNMWSPQYPPNQHGMYPTNQHSMYSTYPYGIYPTHPGMYPTYQQGMQMASQDM